ncbi:imidazole glycerol phosphate synthase subunit HisF [Magnetospira sp. QH-2]|uniref:imidazole glycerol phosphate synthase subunit HisF n=1 Tax=Magnetospira sp. (strain QH-2) TaxID=1288970 RepID=UPI0003E80F4D|nr:imidazole glycerol phosphate synthase cyclase subunit [Magnetospira sp. QH-2]CCQ73072.1 Imidazole glycerol phosphate synthase subunit HisF [Magnetospira sp. QH-2]
MLCKRIITVLTFNNGVLFRTKLFEPDYRYTLNFVDAWSVDEIVVLDVTRSGQGDKDSFFKVVRDFADRCFVPLTVGGGIRSLEDVRRLMGLGADKVVINSGAFEDPRLIGAIAGRYGSQCVVLSIDAKQSDDGGHEVRSHAATRATGRDPVGWAREGQSLGAGEILLTSVERDGWLQGYDLDLCRSVADAVSVPVLILGGCGNWKHMEQGFLQGHASAVCTQNIYHFTEKSIQAAKRYLNSKGIPVRMEERA